MKNYWKFMMVFFIAAITSCSNDDDNVDDPITEGDQKTYQLNSVAVPGIDGTATFTSLSNNTVQIELDLNGTPEGGMHPAHIHFNTAAETGDIALTLGTVDGDTGMSSIVVSSWDDGTPLTYDQLLDFDGYINVHLSADDLGTIVAQGDIGQNELTGVSKSYMLNSVDVDGIDGMASFYERMNGEALAILDINNTPAGGVHPAHIHMNTAAEGGDIAFSFNPVNGDTGMSMTNVAMLDNGTSFMYDDVLSYDGYINVHLSADDLGTIVAQGDIGQNELTGDSKSYTLNSVAVDGIDGIATFHKRMNGEALAVLDINNTPDGGMHPAHIHMNTAAEGGGIAFTFNPVDGDTGMSMTNVSMLDDGNSFLYDDVMDYDGYINVHLSADDLGTIVAQGDIGQNELTGESMSYDLMTTDVPGINGTAWFQERMNGSTLITLELNGTPDGGEHPAHIHENDAATTGPIAISLNPVNGTTGMSHTQISMDENGTSVSYTELLNYDGYINVHLSADDLATIVAQGNIGANAN